MTVGSEGGVKLKIYCTFILDTNRRRHVYDEKTGGNVFMRDPGMHSDSIAGPGIMVIDKPLGFLASFCFQGSHPILMKSFN